jgi:hypothetical protein
MHGRVMPPLDEFARRRLGRALVSLEGAIAQFEAQGTEDVEPNVNRLRRLSDDIGTALELARRGAETKSSRRV